MPFFHRCDGCYTETEIHSPNALYDLESNCENCGWDLGLCCLIEDPNSDGYLCRDCKEKLDKPEAESV